MQDLSKIEVVGGPEDSGYTQVELGPLAAKKDDSSSSGTPAAATPPDTAAIANDTVTEAKPLDASSPAWMWADGIKGEGDKPDYLMEKYKSVAEQAKALPEALKRFGAFKGAPKDGYTTEGLPQGMDKDSPILKGFEPLFKELNLDQDGYNKLAGKFAELSSEITSKSQDEIIKEVGSKDIVNRVENWVKTLPTDVQETVKSWSLSGADIKALDAIRANSPRSSAPLSTEADPRYIYETVKSIEAEKNANFTRYQEDEAYRSEILRRWDAAAGRASLIR